MESPVIIKRKVRTDFTVLPNDLFRDKKLSWKALGLLVYMLHLREDFSLNLSWLTNQKKTGRDAMRSGLKELESEGYLTIRRERGKQGKYQRVIWEVTDSPSKKTTSTATPHSENPNTVNPITDSRTAENPKLINTSSKQEQIITTTTTSQRKAFQNNSVVESVVGVEDLRWPFLFDGGFLSSAKTLIRECPVNQRQMVIDEIAGLMQRGGVRSPIGLLRKLVERAIQGQFTPSAALEYQRRLESKVNATRMKAAEELRLNKQATPATREVARIRLAELRKTVGIQHLKATGKGKL